MLSVIYLFSETTLAILLWLMCPCTCFTNTCMKPSFSSGFRLSPFCQENLRTPVRTNHSSHVASCRIALRSLADPPLCSCRTLFWTGTLTSPVGCLTIAIDPYHISFVPSSVNLLNRCIAYCLCALSKYTEAEASSPQHTAGPDPLRRCEGKQDRVLSMSEPPKLDWALPRAFLALSSLCYG